jgi:hypothetical protein
MERREGKEKPERWTASGELGIRGTLQVRWRRRGLGKGREEGKWSVSVASRGWRG